MQNHHRIGLRTFKTIEPIRDVQTTSEDWKHDPEVAIKHGALYSGACESDYENIVLDNDQDPPHLLNPHESSIETNQTIAKTCATPGKTPESYPDTFHQTDGVHDGRDRGHYINPSAETS